MPSLLPPPPAVEVWMFIPANDHCRRILLALVLCLLVGCGPTAAPAPVPLSEAEYWSETQPIVRSATQHVRLFNKALRGFLDAKEPLTFQQFRLALARLAPEVFALGQRLVAVNPPESALEPHAVLVEAVDLLTLAGRKARLLTEDDYHRHVAAIVVFLPEAQARLAAYSAAFPASAAATVVRQEIAQLGQERIVATTERTFLVTLRSASSTADAQQAVGPFATRWEAEQAAAASRADDVSARIEVEYTYDFHSEIEQPPSGHYWREILWLQELNLLGSLVDTTADGHFIIVASRDGAVQGWRGSGEYLWHEDLNAALVSLGMAADGNRTVLAGYESILLSLEDEDRVIWRSLVPDESHILTQALISADGSHVTLRSEPPDGAGTVHTLSAREYLWSTADYVGARAVALTPDGSKVAIASAKDGVDCLASEPGEPPAVASAQGRVSCFILVDIAQARRLQRFALPSIPEQVALTASGSHAAILSGQEVLFYRVGDESLQWQHRVPGKLLSFTPDGQLLVTAGPGGLLAFSRTGEQLWRREDVQVAKLAVSRQYVVARTDRERLDVYALDGTPLGPVYTPGRVLDFALSSESSLLVATDDQQNMIAWQLPPSP